MPYGAHLRRVDNAVWRGEPSVVRPPRHQVPQVDDERVLPGSHADVHPLATRAHGLQAPGEGAAEPQDGERTVVRVGGCAHLRRRGSA